jgi:hypothetical protein
VEITFVRFGDEDGALRCEIAYEDVSLVVGIWQIVISGT